MSEPKTVVSIRVPKSLAEQWKAEARSAGIGVSECVLRKLAPELVYGTKEHFEAALAPRGASDSVPAETVRAIENIPPEPSILQNPKGLFDQYKAEAEIPTQFALAHSNGIIPLSWFVARHGLTAELVDSMDEFMSIDDPSDFGLNEPAWEFVE